jgi:hypothetical protein
VNIWKHCEDITEKQMTNNKLFSLSLCILTLILLTPLSASAQNVSEDLYRFWREHGNMTNLPSPGEPTHGMLLLNHTTMNSMNYWCDVGKTDDITFTLSDLHGNTLEIWCKRLPTFTLPNNETVSVFNHSRQFIGYYNQKFIIGLCPYEQGLNQWGWTTDENGLISSTFWESKALNGTTMVFNMTFNRP